MEENYQQIKKLVLESPLPPSDREELITLFANSKEDLSSLTKLCSDDPSWIKKINDNYRAKRAALIAGNSALWKKIIQTEEAELNDLGE